MKKPLRQLFFTLFERSRLVLGNNRAEAYLSDLPPYKVAEVVIKGTTYIVSSFFKKDAKGTVVDKISRLIEREVMSNAKNEVA